MERKNQPWYLKRRILKALVFTALSMAVIWPLLWSYSRNGNNNWIVMAAISALLTVAWSVAVVYFVRMWRQFSVREPLLMTLSGLLALDALRSAVTYLIIGLGHAERAGIPGFAGNEFLSSPWHMVLPWLFSVMIVAYILWAIRDDISRELVLRKIREDEISQRNAYLTAIHTIGQTMGTSLNRDEILENTLRKVLELLQMDGARLYLLDELGESLQLAGYVAYDPLHANPPAVISKDKSISWKVLKSAKPVVSEHLEKDEQLIPQAMFSKGVGGFACIPLRSKGQSTGVLLIGNTAPRAFSALDIQFLLDVGQQLGMSIENANLLAREQARRLEVESLLAISNTFGVTLDYDETLQTVVEEARKILGVDYTSLRLFDDEKKILTCAAVSGVTDHQKIQLLTENIDPWKDDKLIIALEQRRPVVTTNVVDDLYVDPDNSIIDACSLLGVPLIFRDEVIGFLFAVTREKVREFSLRDQRIASALARHAAMTIQNARLYKLTTERATELEEAKEFSEGLINGMLELVFEIDDAGICTYVNKYGAELLGYEPEELINQSVWSDFIVGYGHIEQAYHSALAGQARDLEIPMKHRDGSEILISWNAVIFNDPTGNLDRVICVGRDARERNRLQEEILRRNRELSVLNSIVETINQSLDLDRILKGTLNHLMEFLKIDAASVVLKDELTGEMAIRACQGLQLKNLNAFCWAAGEAPCTEECIFVEEPMVHHGEEVSPELKELMEREDLQTFACFPLKSDRKLMGMLNVASHLKREFNQEDLDLLKRAANQLATAVINSRLYQAEQRKAQSLAVLMREAHHRIRNNLQTVAGLLDLELQKGSGRLTEVSLRKSLHRIKSVALVHEMLLQDNAQAVDMRAFAQKLAHSTRQTGTTRDKDIHIEVSGDRIVLASRLATSVALAINELVENSIEHGFKNRSAGSIQIELENQNGKGLVRVSDDGIGLPTDFDLSRQANVGLRVVKGMIVQDMGGVFTLTRGEKTVATIEFPGSGEQVLQQEYNHG